MVTRSLGSTVYGSLVRPFLFREDPEAMHRAAVASLRVLGCFPGACQAVESTLTVDDPRLVREWQGLRFRNPIGLAAGFIKSEVDALVGARALGFGFVELGTVTGRPQAGTPPPRVFRLPDDKAAINRFGFNSPGAEATAAAFVHASPLGIPLILNIGLSKVVSPDDEGAVHADYCFGLRALYPFGDAFTVNVSSPNTTGLRDLQRRAPMRSLIKAIIYENLRLAKELGIAPKPMFVKVTCDLSDEGLTDVIEVFREVESLGVPMGLILTNTTLERQGLRSLLPLQREKGGLSGQPLTERAQLMVELVRDELPDVFLIGVGGIQTADQAFQRLQFVDVIQVYTGMVYEGPTLAHDLNRGLLRILENESTRRVSPRRFYQRPGVR